MFRFRVWALGFGLFGVPLRVYGLELKSFRAQRV